MARRVTPVQRPGGRPRRGRRFVVVLMLALLVVPTLEIALIVLLGQRIGGWPTLALLLVESALGAWLVKREGARSWSALAEAIATGRMPSRQLSDAALVLVGGTLLLTPGFLTDLVGFACILPFTRPVAARVLERIVSRKLLAGLVTVRGTGPSTASGDTIRGELL